MRRAVPTTAYFCICLWLLAPAASTQPIDARELCRAGEWDAPTAVVAARSGRPVTGVYFKFEQTKFCADRFFTDGRSVTLVGNAMAIDKAGNDTRAVSFILDPRAAEAFLRERPDTTQR